MNMDLQKTVSSDHFSEKELLSQLEEAHKVVEIGAIYAHYRNPEGRYRVIGLAIIESTQEVGVIYKKESASDALNSVTWIRPISSWLEKVHVGDACLQRFQRP